MKTFFSLVGLYCVVIIFGAIFGFGVTLLFILATNIVVGNVVAQLALDQTLFLLLLWVGMAAVASNLFTVVYTIRYPENGMTRVITHTILCLVSWLVVIPLSLEFSSKLAEFDLLKPKEVLLTANYFRPHEGKLYYYTTVDAATKTADGVVFTLNSLDNATDGSQLLKNTPLLKSSIAPFSDVLIYDTLPRSTFIKFVLPSLYKNQLFALEMLQGGVFSWLAFASWGLALYTLVGLRRLFHWRLLNFIAVNLGFMAICVLNLYYIWGWNGRVFGLVTIPSWLMNCIIAAILSCMGILLAIFRPDPNMEYVA